MKEEEINRDGQDRQDKEKAMNNSYSYDFCFYPVHPVHPCYSFVLKDMKVEESDEHIMAGRAIWISDAVEESWLYAGGDTGSDAGHRCEYGYLLGGQCGASACSAL
jgi:hypothetical protein